MTATREHPVRCRECGKPTFNNSAVCDRDHRPIPATVPEPRLCPFCDTPTPSLADWYCRDCDPVECECEAPNPDGIGECRSCRRRVMPGASTS